jgi:hypothetical protein
MLPWLFIGCSSSIACISKVRDGKSTAFMIPYWFKLWADTCVKAHGEVARSKKDQRHLLRDRRRGTTACPACWTIWTNEVKQCLLKKKYFVLGRLE